ESLAWECFRIRPECACRDRHRTELSSSQTPFCSTGRRQPRGGACRWGCTESTKRREYPLGRFQRCCADDGRACRASSEVVTLLRGPRPKRSPLRPSIGYWMVDEHTAQIRT